MSENPSKRTIMWIVTIVLIVVLNIYFFTIGALKILWKILRAMADNARHNILALIYGPRSQILSMFIFGFLFWDYISYVGDTFGIVLDFFADNFISFIYHAITFYYKLKIFVRVFIRVFTWDFIVRFIPYTTWFYRKIKWVIKSFMLFIKNFF